MLKRGSKIYIICWVAVLFTLTWIVFLRVWSDAESRYTCKLEENLFSMGMESMNETRKETYALAEGDAIDVSVVFIAGELNVSITDSDGNTIYEGHNPEMGSFQVNIPESGDYTISVTGRQAEGSISFQIIRQ